MLTYFQTIIIYAHFSENEFLQEKKKKWQSLEQKLKQQIQELEEELKKVKEEADKALKASKSDDEVRFKMRTKPKPPLFVWEYVFYLKLQLVTQISRRMFPWPKERDLHELKWLEF